MTNSENLDKIDIDELIREAEAIAARQKVRRDNPWVLDIIRVLWPRPSGMHMNRLEPKIWEIRNPDLPKPKKFRDTIQSALNRHTSQSMVFLRQGRKSEDDLFYSPDGKGSGTWAVRRDKAVAWLEKKKLPPA